MSEGARRWGGFCRHPEHQSPILLLSENGCSQACDLRIWGPSRSLLTASRAGGWVGTVCGSKGKRFVLESQCAGADGFPLPLRGHFECPCPSVKERNSGCQHSNAPPSERAEWPWPGDWPPVPWTWFWAAERKPFSSFFTRWFLRIGDGHSDAHRRGVCYLWRRY